MNSFIPKSWTLTSIGEITNSESLFKDGDWVESKDQDPSGNNRLIQLADVGDGRFINKSSRFMNDEQFTRLKCTELKKGDVLVARMPEPLGRACIYPLNNTKAATIVDIAIIRTKNADHYWLMSAINSSDFRYHIDLNASGTTRTRIARSALSKLKLIAPPLPEQQKIAKILTSVDEVIEKTQAQIDKLKDLKTGMMQELLTNGIGNNGKPHTKFKDSPVGKIPAEWEVGGIYDYCSEVFLGLTAKVDYTESEGIFLVRATDISKGILSFDKARKITLEQHQSLTKKRQAKRGDVLISKSGSLGVCAIVETDIEFSIYESIIVLQPKCGIIDSKYLLWLMRTTDTQTRLLGSTVGSTVGHLNLGDFRKLKIPIPTISEQIKLGEMVDSLNERHTTIENKLQKYRSIKKALMQDLLTGKVRVNVELTA
ncbi:MAG: restriction endonuclease subunit S [Colwellia sp.]|nr:restriction endonuclease subunit S [Colwellia sp.]